MPFYECSVCCDAFSHDTSPSEPKTPILGKCGHCFCRECIPKLQAAQFESANRHVVNISCPECKRKSFRLDTMTPNRGLCAALEVFYNNAGTSEARGELSPGSGQPEMHVQPSEAPPSNNETSASASEAPSRPKRQRVATAQVVTPQTRSIARRAETDTEDDSRTRSRRKTSRSSPRTSRASSRQVAATRDPETVQQVAACDTPISSPEEPRSDNGNNEVSASDTETKVKTEKDVILKLAVEHRKYGDRVLLGRQRANGMMRLGGGNTTMDLYPGENNYNHPRFQDIGHRKAICYNDSWQPFGPQYAGQVSAHVRTVPDRSEPFSVFMRRGQLGSEYVGEYRSADPERDIITYTAAHNVRQKDKNKMIRDIVKSLGHANGEWKDEIQYYRELLTSELKRDNSPAGPEWLIEGRKPTMDETEQKQQHSLAARARALKYKPGMPDDKIAKLVVELDEFHETDPIVFVEYSEKIYNYVKDGATTRNSKGKSREGGERCAIASDWYATFDQQV